MGIFDRFRKKEKREQDKKKVGFYINQRGAYDFYIDGYTPIGDSPEFETAINKIADLVSNMTIHLMQNTDKGDIRVKNALAKKIDISPCNFMTKKAWVKFIVKNMIKNGNAVVFPFFDENGYIENLVPINTRNIDFLWDYEKQDYYMNFEGTRYYSGEFIHFVLEPDEEESFKGRGYRISLTDINDALKMATETKKSFLKGKYMPNLVIKVDSNSEALESEEGREQFEEKYLTRKENGRPWIIPAEMMEINQIKPLTINDLALNDSVVLDKKTVASMLGIPAFFLGVGNFNKQEYNNFINTTIMSFGKIIEQTLTKALIYSPDLYFRLSPRSLYSYDISEIANIGMSMYTRGLVYGNEVRDWVGMTPLDELNKLVILENYIPADKIGDQNKLKGGGDNGEEE